jgi:hypothetical protein
VTGIVGAFIDVLATSIDLTIALLAVAHGLVVFHAARAAAALNASARVAATQGSGVASTIGRAMVVLVAFDGVTTNFRVSGIAAVPWWTRAEGLMVLNVA